MDMPMSPAVDRDLQGPADLAHPIVGQIVLRCRTWRSVFGICGIGQVM